MKSAVETLSPTRVKLSVEVPFDDLKASIDAAYKKIGSQINVPGFRRGKVPAAIIDQRVGRDAVILEAVNEVLPSMYDQALAEHELTALSSPELDIEPIAYGADVSFSAEIDVVPPITLPEFHGLEVAVDAIEVDDATIEDELTALRSRFGTLTVVERAAADGDFVTMNLSATKDGEPIDEAEATDMSYQVGRGTMLDGLDETLVGMVAGDERVFEGTLVGGEYKDQPVDITVTVTAVKEQDLPDLDDAFAQQASEFDTADELRADIREQALRRARLEQASQARDAALEKLLSLVELPLPDAAVDEERSSRRDAIIRQLSQMGVTEDEYLATEGKTVEEHEAELGERVRDAMKAQFILQEVAKAEDMGVTEQELTNQLIRRAQQSGLSPEQYVTHAVEHNHIPELVAEVRRGKALAHIVETAVVTDSNGEKVELALLLPDGTYADPAEVEAAQQAVETAAAPAKDAASNILIGSDFITEAPTP